MVSVHNSIRIAIVASYVRERGQQKFASMSPEAIEGAIEEIAKMLKDNPNQEMYFVQVED